MAYFELFALYFVGLSDFLRIYDDLWASGNLRMIFANREK